MTARILYHLFPCTAPTKTFNVGRSSFYAYIHITQNKLEQLTSTA